MKTEHSKQKVIGNSLRKYRKVRGLKQHEVARILGLKSASMISRWETGVCIPDTLNLFRLAALYRTMLDALFMDHLQMLRAELTEKEQLILQNQTEESSPYD